MTLVSLASRDEPDEFRGHGLVCLWCSHVSLARHASLLGPFPPRALPRLPGTTGRSATHRGVAFARHPGFAPATHPLRPRWASRVPPLVPFPACCALRPRQILRRSRHHPRLLVPSRAARRSASARFLLRGSTA